MTGFREHLSTSSVMLLTQLRCADSRPLQSNNHCVTTVSIYIRIFFNNWFLICFLNPKLEGKILMCTKPAPHQETN